MATGDVLFSKDLEDDKSDIWDDTALIKAYDEAVSSMKAQLAEHLGEPEYKPSGPAAKKKHKKNRRKHKNKEKEQQSTSTGGAQWKAGDRCRAVFTSDGQIYEALVMEIHPDDHTCTVRYLGYGNEEEQALGDLLSSRQQRGMSDAASECDSVDVSVHSHGSRGSHSRGGGHHGNLGRGRGLGGPPPAMPPMPPPPFMAGRYGNMMPPRVGGQGDFMMPPMMPPMFPPTAGFPSFPNMQMPGAPMPRVPDIPPPDDLDGDLSSDQEALHNMLISWYMSGYHSGYYQGLKQGRKAGQKGKPCLPSEKPTESSTESHPAHSTESHPAHSTESHPAHSKQKSVDKDLAYPSVSSD